MALDHPDNTNQPKSMSPPAPPLLDTESDVSPIAAQTPGGRVWAVAELRHMIFMQFCLPIRIGKRKILAPLLTLSKAFNPEVVHEMNRMITERQFARLIAQPDSEQIELAKIAARYLHVPIPLDPHLLSNILHDFPNLEILNSPTCDITIDHGSVKILRCKLGYKYHPKVGPMIVFPNLDKKVYPNTIVTYQFTDNAFWFRLLQAVHAPGIEDDIYPLPAGLPPIFAYPMDDMQLEECEIPALTNILKLRKKFGLKVPRTIKLDKCSYTWHDLRLFLGQTDTLPRSLVLDAEYSTPPFLSSLWKLLDWSTITGLKHFDICLRLDWRGKWESTPPVSVSSRKVGRPGHMESFNLVIAIPDDVDIFHSPERLVDRLPSAIVLAQNMLDIGGTGCKYYLSLTSTQADRLDENDPDYGTATVYPINKASPVYRSLDWEMGHWDHLKPIQDVYAAKVMACIKQLSGIPQEADK